MHNGDNKLAQDTDTLKAKMGFSIAITYNITSVYQSYKKVNHIEARFRPLLHLPPRCNFTLNRYDCQLIRARTREINRSATSSAKAVCQTLQIKQFRCRLLLVQEPNRTNASTHNNTITGNSRRILQNQPVINLGLQPIYLYQLEIYAHRTAINTTSPKSKTFFRQVKP